MSLLRGALSGLAGAFAMQQFRTNWNTQVAASAHDGVFGLDDEADINSVNLLAKTLCGSRLNERDALRLALVMHYIYGASAGALYEWMANKVDRTAECYGMLYGAVIWLIGDECLMTFSGISDARKKSANSHASALASHLLFGVLLEVGRRQIA
jgi:hypothetical protein